MFYRRKLLLGLLDAVGRSVPRTELQKLLFLVCDEQSSQGQKPSYEFVPYRYGCYSFQAEADKKTLTRYRVLRDADDWVLSRVRRTPGTLQSHDREAIDRVLTRVGSLRGYELVRHVYRAHPYYAINSEIRHKLLNGAELAAVEAASPSGSEPCLFTVGYEGRTLESYLNTLIMARVRVLCDLRRNPLSMKFGFSKRQLSNAVSNLGIEYVHLPQLGIASSKRRSLAASADYRALFDEYRRTTLVDNKAVLDRIVTLLAEHRRIALTCFEADPENCHRGCVADALSRNKNFGSVVAHL